LRYSRNAISAPTDSDHDFSLTVQVAMMEGGQVLPSLTGTIAAAWGLSTRAAESETAAHLTSPGIGPDVPAGTGVSDVPGILDELKRQHFAGNISIEYEYNWENNVIDCGQCVGFVRGCGQRQ